MFIRQEYPVENRSRTPPSKFLGYRYSPPEENFRAVHHCFVCLSCPFILYRYHSYLFMKHFVTFALKHFFINIGSYSSKMFIPSSTPFDVT